MILKVNAYFREGNLSYYPGETHLKADLVERGFTETRLDYLQNMGNLEETGDADPETSRVDEGALQAAMAAVGAEEIPQSALAEGSHSAPMPEAGSDEVSE